MLVAGRADLGRLHILMVDVLAELDTRVCASGSERRHWAWTALATRSSTARSRPSGSRSCSHGTRPICSQRSWMRSDAAWAPPRSVFRSRRAALSVRRALAISSGSRSLNAVERLAKKVVLGGAEPLPQGVVDVPGAAGGSPVVLELLERPAGRPSAGRVHQPPGHCQAWSLPWT